jgi:hypothetical protein
MLLRKMLTALRYKRIIRDLIHCMSYDWEAGETKKEFSEFIEKYYSDKGLLVILADIQKFAKKRSTYLYAVSNLKSQHFFPFPGFLGNRLNVTLSGNGPL